MYRYIAERDADPDDLVIELEGELSGDRDLDADAGALVVLPTRVVGTQPFDTERLRRLRATIGS